MEYAGIEVDSVASGIKRRVKDRIAKTKLNVSLASKIKTKLWNNSSIFKISLKHNNRALARALSKEKENSRRITTEKMQLQKEVEKLNFENTFLRLKLNNLNKKLIEIESQVSSHLLTAIEMSSLSEFHQSSLLLSSNKKNRISKQCKPAPLPYARVPLTSENDDDDDDDDDDDKWKTKCNNRTVSKTSPDSTSSESRQPSSLHQNNSEVSLPKQDNQKTCGSGHSEHTSSVDVLPNESHCHSDQSPKRSLSEMKTVSSSSLRREKLSLGNVTKRKKCVSSIVDILCVTDLDHQPISSPGSNWNNDINGGTNETSNNTQRNTECFPDLPSESSSDPNAKCTEQVQKSTDSFHLQKTVYEDADMELTATDVGKIVTISKGNKKQNKKKADCRKETSRKVKDTSSDKKRESSKRRCQDSSEVGAEEKTENRPERDSGVLDGRGDSEDPDCISSTEQLSQVNMQKKIILQNSLDQENIQNKKRRQTYRADEQEETYPFSRHSVRFLQDGKFDLYHNTLHRNLSKPSRQTFVIHKSEKDNLLPNQEDKDTISENLEVANESHVADLSIKANENVRDHETQTMLDLKKYVTAQQNQTNKTKQKINRRTKIISIPNQIHEDNDKDIHVLEKGNFPSQTQANKETTSGNLEASKEFETPLLFTRDNGSLRDCKIQNVLDLQKKITSIYPAQNESQISKNPRQKVNRKTEIISGVNCFSNDRGVHCSENDKSFLLQKDKDIPGTLKDFSEFDTPAFCNKDSAKSCDYKTETLLELKKHDPNMQHACREDSKVDKKLRQKVNRKTEIISKINQIHENDGGSAHDPLNKNLCHKVNISEIISQLNQIYEPINEDGNGFKSSIKDCQDVLSCDFGEINSNKKENCDPIQDPCILVTKTKKKVSYKTGNSLTRDKNRCILQLTDSSQVSVTLDSGLKHGPNEADSGPGEQTNLPKKQKQSTVSSLGDAFSVSAVKEGSLPAKAVNKMAPKSKKRKTLLGCSDTHGTVEVTPNTDLAKAVDSQQTDKENYLENEKMAKSKPDFYTKVLKPLSQMCSSNIKNSSLDSMCKSSLPLSISSSKTLMLEERSSLESTCIFQVGDDAHEKIKEGTHNPHHRTQKSRPGNRTSLVLMDTSCVSSNTANPENESEGQSSYPMRRKRQCTPVSLTEPSLRSKMRR
ncbi:shugoshin 2-like isoform X2 [Grammomys surdaster]|uniref:shugoshin 2-like isoform X2 n=1 Tax=Grammomys surdaster TaxID=491861 RepID=UPI00109FC417|nr:shugoshin 2-like isoform X2 [Grammomys surdaster]